MANNLFSEGKEKHCISCNVLMDAALKRCPVCQARQSKAVERLVLLAVLLIVVIVAYLQLRQPEVSPPLFASTRQSQGTPSSTSVPSIPIAQSTTSRAVPDQPTTARFQSPQKRTSQQSNRAPSATKPRRYQGTQFLQDAGDYPFYVAQKQWNSRTRKYDFYRQGMHGSEVLMQNDVRRYFLSENQSDYPEPGSGCGPTALLNLYIWYTKFGLLEESIKHSDPERYKQLKFREIDQNMLQIQRESRTAAGGTNTLEQIAALDALVQKYSRQPTRLHFEVKRPPLTNQDFLKLIYNFRCGILSGQPKDLTTGRLQGHHAALVTYADRDGMITIANWGKFSHGRLIEKEGAQWFVPSKPGEHSIRINYLTTLIPFIPSANSYAAR